MENLITIDRVMFKKLVRKELNEISKYIKQVEKEYPRVEGYVVNLKDSLEIY